MQAGGLVRQSIVPVVVVCRMVSLKLDAVIFGGSALALWLLDGIVRRGGQAVLLDDRPLGAGTTIHSSGLLHAAREQRPLILDQPPRQGVRRRAYRWVKALESGSRSALAGCATRGDCLYVFPTSAAASRPVIWRTPLARRVPVVNVSAAERPDWCTSAAELMTRISEPVLSPRALLEAWQRRHSRRLVQTSIRKSVELVLGSPGEVREIRVSRGNSIVRLLTDHVILASEHDNADLRELAGLTGGEAPGCEQPRVLVRGPLPIVNGHALDAHGCRWTVVAERLSDRQSVWMLTGRVLADIGDCKTSAILGGLAAELASTFPQLAWSETEWALTEPLPVEPWLESAVSTTSALAASERRPEGFGSRRALGRPSQRASVSRVPGMLCAGTLTTAWSGGLATVPYVAEEVFSRIDIPERRPAVDLSVFDDWPRPELAALPWETVERWRPIRQLVSSTTLDQRRAA